MLSCFKLLTKSGRSMTVYDKLVNWQISPGQNFIGTHMSENRKKDYIHKLSQEQVESIRQHYESDDVSFPLPDQKLHGKRFMRFFLKKSALMYNMCSITTRKISVATYHKYKPKAFKLQGTISLRQSYSEKCQNLENILSDASKHMKSIPRDVGDTINNSLCDYEGYFPKIMCVSHTCEKCGKDKYKKYILEVNASKLSDKSRRF